MRVKHEVFPNLTMLAFPPQSVSVFLTCLTIDVSLISLPTPTTQTTSQRSKPLRGTKSSTKDTGESLTNAHTSEPIPTPH